MITAVVGFLAAGGGIALGYFIGRFRTSTEIREGIRRGVEHDRALEKFARHQAMLRNGRETWRRPEHDGEPPTTTGVMDLDPDR